MIGINEAYKILGVSSNASKNDIERRYSTILKKYRITSADGQASGEAIDIDEITTAYNLLMGYEEPQTEEEVKPSNPLMKKMGIDEKKAKNFFYYYKIHMIVAIIILIAVAATVRGCVTKVNPDFNIAFLGEIAFNETAALKQTIQQKVPEIKEPGFDGAFIASGDSAGGGQQEYAMQMKAMVLFAAADIDLFVIDKVNFERYADQGAFISLDDIAPRLGVDSSKSKPYTMGTKDDATPHIFGIDISGSEVLEKSGILGKELIAAIPVRSKHTGNAEKVIKLLLK